MALGDIYLRLAWQAWHLVTSTFHLHVKRGTCGGRVLVALLVAVSRRGTLCGRRGTWRHPPSLCVADVALGDINLHFALQAWHLVTSTFVLRGRRGHLVTSTFLLRGRRGMAVVALGWVRWRAWSPPVTPGHFVWQAWDLATSMVHWRGRRTWRHPPSLSVAGLALGDIHLHFAWQAWNLATSTYVFAWQTLVAWLGPVGHPQRHGTLRALGGIHLDLHFAWQAWHRPSFGVAGVAQLCHTQLAQNFFTHIPLTHNFVTHNFVTHNLSHTHLSHMQLLSHTHLCHPQLCHTQSFTHTHTHTHTSLSLTCNFSLTHTSLSHTTLSHTTFSHTTLSHTTLSHAIFHTQLCHTHTTLPHTTLSNAQLCDTQLFTYNF